MGNDYSMSCMTLLIADPSMRSYGGGMFARTDFGLGNKYDGNKNAFYLVPAPPLRGKADTNENACKGGLLLS